ncbi:pyridoxamine 5'-phosphate oxidase family protein [Streptomyces sp. NPDC059788]|uniref:pyridoxamine 5'-phosphate oxidase family protein n=1 Tax=Streptomyces sp. NPDC059788 TaxID=3346948 RepID=UPI00365BB7B3
MNDPDHALHPGDPAGTSHSQDGTSRPRAGTRPQTGTRHPQALDPAVRDRLATERIAWLCTLRPDGSPHVTPVWFVFLRDTWWIGADRASVKVRNVGHDPRVSLALEGGEAPVVAEGRAKVWHVLPDGGISDGSHTSRTSPEVVAAFLAKYDWDATATLPSASGRVLFEVPVGRWLLAGTAQ